MPDDPTPQPPTPTPPADPPKPEPPKSDPAPPADPPVPGEDALGDAGKKALDEMKAKWKAAEAASRQQAEELAALKAAAEGREAEHKAAVEAQKVKDEALKEANVRILKAEVRAAAAGKMTDPADALRYLDLSSFEVGDEGEVDGAAVQSAINDLLKDKPYLAAQGARFEGGADGGPRNEDAKAQLTKSDVDRMSPAEVHKAREEGRLNTLLGIGT